jgi:hypothetical protein
MDFVPVAGSRVWRGGSLENGLNQMDSNKKHIILQGEKTTIAQNKFLYMNSR